MNLPQKISIMFSLLEIWNQRSKNTIITTKKKSERRKCNQKNKVRHVKNSVVNREKARDEKLGDVKRNRFFCGGIKYGGGFGHHDF